jgi:ribosomal protein S20
MANTAQARKRARQSVKVNAHNAALRSTLRTAIKKVVKAIESGDKAVAMAAYQENVSVIDRIADKKIIHKNKAARHKSRLTAAIKALKGNAPVMLAKKTAPKAAVKAKPAPKPAKTAAVKAKPAAAPKAKAAPKAVAPKPKAAAKPKATK